MIRRKLNLCGLVYNITVESARFDSLVDTPLQG